MHASVLPPLLRKPVARAALVALALLGAGAASAQSTVLRMQTNVGTLDIQLLDAEAPKTVANFLTYVRAGDYNGVLFHRSISDFIIQTGGYRWPPGAPIVGVTKRNPVDNEFSPTRSNVRGTLAMAKVGVKVGNVEPENSATSEWFINLVDNSANLDTQNKGFTVFARLSTPSLAVADSIGKLPTVNVGSQISTWTNLPVYNWVQGTLLDSVNMVSFSKFTEFPAQAGKTDSDRIFDFLEKTYPQYVPVEGKQSGVALGYVYRYYPKTNSYVGTKDNQVWYLVPAISNDIQRLGTLTDWLVTAATSGN